MLQCLFLFSQTQQYASVLRPSVCCPDQVPWKTSTIFTLTGQVFVLRTGLLSLTYGLVDWPHQGIGFWGLLVTVTLNRYWQTFEYWHCYICMNVCEIYLVSVSFWNHIRRLAETFRPFVKEQSNVVSSVGFFHWRKLERNTFKKTKVSKYNKQ